MKYTPLWNKCKVKRTRHHSVSLLERPYQQHDKRLQIFDYSELFFFLDGVYATNKYIFFCLYTNALRRIRNAESVVIKALQMILEVLSHLIYPLTTRVVGTPQMIVATSFLHFRNWNETNNYPVADFSTINQYLLHDLASYLSNK